MSSSMTDDDNQNYESDGENENDILDSNDIETSARTEIDFTAKSTITADSMDDNNSDIKVPSFPALTAAQISGSDSEYHRISVPPHRYTPLKTHWMELYQPIVEHMKLQIRFNPKKRCVELRTSEKTESPNSLQKSSDFIRAFCLGFDVRDAIALLRLDDLYIDSFEIKDVKTLNGEHLSRAIGRIAGQSGKTKYTIENTTKTRIVLADTQIHILGSYANIQIAKNAIVRLIMGSPASKIFNQLRTVANRQKERF